MARPEKVPVPVFAANPERWDDLVRLFGAKGACAGCWCMFPRLARPAWEKGKGDGNKRALKRLVATGPPPGLLAYLDEIPVGWISLGPRETFPTLARSRVAKAPDERPAWHVVCLFVAKEHRRKGISKALIDAAAKWATKRGARLLDACPVEPHKGPMPDAFVWHGVASSFRACGFVEIARRSPTRPYVRRELR
jgi:GNAT superfamily N-acetyltransferase